MFHQWLEVWKSKIKCEEIMKSYALHLFFKQVDIILILT